MSTKIPKLFWYTPPFSNRICPFHCDVDWWFSSLGPRRDLSTAVRKVRHCISLYPTLQWWQLAYPFPERPGRATLPIPDWSSWVGMIGCGVVVPELQITALRYVLWRDGAGWGAWLTRLFWAMLYPQHSGHICYADADWIIAETSIISATSSEHLMATKMALLVRQSKSFPEYEQKNICLGWLTLIGQSLHFYAFR